MKAKETFKLNSHELNFNHFIFEITKIVNFIYLFKE